MVSWRGMISWCMLLLHCGFNLQSCLQDKRPMHMWGGTGQPCGTVWALSSAMYHINQKSSSLGELRPITWTKAKLLQSYYMNKSKAFRLCLFATYKFQIMIACNKVARFSKNEKRQTFTTKAYICLLFRLQDLKLSAARMLLWEKKRAFQRLILG